MKQKMDGSKLHADGVGVKEIRLKRCTAVPFQYIFSSIYFYLVCVPLKEYKYCKSFGFANFIELWTCGPCGPCEVYYSVDNQVFFDLRIG